MSEPLIPSGADPVTQQAILGLGRQKQEVNHTLFNRAPLTGEVPESGVVFAKIAATVYGYTKVQGVLYRWALVIA